MSEQVYKLFLQFLAEFDVMPRELQDKVMIIMEGFRDK